MRVIRRYARAIAEEFQPDKIILFGSYAYGTPHQDSDVDLLVVMPTRDQHAQAVRIRYRLAAPFPIDLLIRTPKQLAWRLEDGESFTTTIGSKGKTFMKKSTRRQILVAIAPARSCTERSQNIGRWSAAPRCLKMGCILFDGERELS
jgi:predicted nucleotidyltransferase